jgi:DNA-binding ferritin-like protein
MPKMTRTNINKRTKRSKTMTKRSTSTSFDKEITVKFLEMLMMVKLFHWKTHSYATHKATDELYDSMNSNIDKFVEVLLGKTGSRIDLTNRKTISLIDLGSTDKLKERIESFKKYLVNLNQNKAIASMSNTDLLNIRDELLADLNQFLYLLTFK